MKQWKLVPKETKLKDPIWKNFTIQDQKRIKSVLFIIVRAQSEQRAREIVGDHFLPFHLDQTQKGDETLFIELSESPFASTNFVDCDAIRDDKSPVEQIIQISYRPNSGFDNQVF